MDIDTTSEETILGVERRAVSISDESRRHIVGKTMNERGSE